MAFVLNYYTEGKGEEGKRKSQYFLCKEYDLSLYLTETNLPVPDSRYLENLERAFGNLLLELH